MGKILRQVVVFLTLVLLLQCVAMAAEVDVPEPTPVHIETNLSNGEVFTTPMQNLTVQADADGIALDAAAITVTCRGKRVTPADGSYALQLKPGENEVVITAMDQSVTLTLRYDIQIPDGWARKALAFCVKYGILNGDTNGDLNPTAKASRAELAAMLVRLFNAKPMADISGYTDVVPGAWYEKEMARAVAMGLFEGSGDKLMPQGNLTREQAFTVLARAFGVASDATKDMEAFSDGKLVSNWAAAGVAGMLEAGYIHGGTDGKLNPAGDITRQELAQVLYNALDCITDDPNALSGKRCLYTGDLAALEGRSYQGDLILSRNTDADVSIRDLSVSGRLVLHLHGAATATLDASCGALSVCSPVKLTAAQPVKTLLCLRDGANVRGDATRALISGKSTLRGTYDELICLSGKPTIAAGSTAKELRTARGMTGSKLKLNGTVNELHAQASRLSITGTGQIETLYLYRNNTDVSCTVGTTVDRIDAGLEGVRVTADSTPDVYYDITTVTVSGTISGVNTKQAYGVPSDGRVCTVVYRYRGKVLKTEENFRLTNGAKLSCDVTPTITYHEDATHQVDVSISYGYETIHTTLPVNVHGRFTDYHDALQIHTVKVMATIRYSASLYAYSSLSGYIGSVSAGEIVTFIKSNGTSALIVTSSGRQGWVADSAVRVSWQTYHNDNVSYSTGAKEAFVNQVHNYSSKTKYLIWCNLYTATVNIFEGSQGNWKLIKSSKCTIGAPVTPTRVGVFSLYARAYYWDFGNDTSRCYYASLFDGGIAFHTRLYYTGTNTMVNSTLGAELSHGCVRCPDDIAKFIYYDCPLGTTVVVY